MRIIAVIMLVGLFASQGVFAADALTVESIFPEDGGKGLQTTNQMARIVFSGNIDIEKNSKYFQIVDSKGEKQPILVLEQPDKPNRVNLVLKGNLKESEEYTIIVSEKLTDTDGNKLGTEYKTSFKTKNAKTESLVTTGMMVVMFGAIIIITVRDTTKQQREEARERAEAKSGKKKPEKNNPYKDTKKEAERIYAQKKREKEQKVRQKMRENEQKRNAKKRK